MNLSKMYTAQNKLDDHIIKEKGLEGKDLLPELILALQVELGECANEWRGFKFWSNNRKPRTKSFSRNGTMYDDGFVPDVDNPLLEEYVDCLHFILSIGLKLEQFEPKTYRLNQEDITYLFRTCIAYNWDSAVAYPYGFTAFITLGEKLGFTWDEIETAYFEKNSINHERQENGY